MNCAVSSEAFCALLPARQASTTSSAAAPSGGVAPGFPRPCNQFHLSSTISRKSLMISPCSFCVTYRHTPSLQCQSWIQKALHGEDSKFCNCQVPMKVHHYFMLNHKPGSARPMSFSAKLLQQVGRSTSGERSMPATSPRSAARRSMRQPWRTHAVLPPASPAPAHCQPDSAHPAAAPTTLSQSRTPFAAS